MFFFFKQKTAYEMRISDWSSDVCSSDLRKKLWTRRLTNCRVLLVNNSQQARPWHRSFLSRSAAFWSASVKMAASTRSSAKTASPGTSRSEEHTSELQSLMRISYAVFCLKKKIYNKLANTPH